MNFTTFLVIIIVDSLHNVLQNIDQIQMDLSYGFNAFKGIMEACPGATIGEKQRCFLLNQPQEQEIFLVGIVRGVLVDERIHLMTRKGERIKLKLNCRENLTLSTEYFSLQLESLAGDDNNRDDVAVIKFSTSPVGEQKIYPAVCEGLILSKF